MSSYHAVSHAVDGRDGHFISHPWVFAPWDYLKSDSPEWILRGFWYEGYDGSFVVVFFNYYDEPPWFSGKIVRFKELAHVEKEFERLAQSEPGSWEDYDGVYLFNEFELLRHSGVRFSDYTGLRELPDNRW